MLGLFFLSFLLLSFLSPNLRPCLSSPRLLSRLLSRSPWFLSERPFCGRSPLWNLCPPLPSWRSPLRPSLPPRLSPPRLFLLSDLSFLSDHSFLSDLSGLSLLSGRLFCVLSAAGFSVLFGACASSADAFCAAERSERLAGRPLFTCIGFPCPEF